MFEKIVKHKSVRSPVLSTFMHTIPSFADGLLNNELYLLKLQGVSSSVDRVLEIRYELP